MSIEPVASHIGPNLGLQLYSVREELSGDFDGVIRQIAAMGYSGVEPTFNIPGTTVARAAGLFQELGFEVPSAHVPLPLGLDRKAVLEYMRAVVCRRVVSGKGPDSFSSVEKIKRTCAQFNEALDVCSAEGLELGYHNHWWEFGAVDGHSVYEIMMKELDPAIFMEVDTYWVQAAGFDPAKIVSDLGPRADLLHIKDGPAVQDEPMVAVGDGVMDIASIVIAGQHARWLIVELDRCETDMVEAVAKSYEFLAVRGPAHAS